MFSAEDMARFWPDADPAWRDAFVKGHREWGMRWGLRTPLRWRHFLAQVSAETAGLNTSGRGGLPLKGLVENHHYSAAGILKVFDKRLRLAARDNPRYRGKTIAEIAAIWSRNPEMFFEGTYGGRKELGNTQPGDGWRFRGRGPLQPTGRETYALIGRELGVDCVAHPELLEEPAIGWQASFVEWSHSNCNALADKNDVKAVSLRVNGGTNGLAERRAWLRRAEQFFPDASVWQDYQARETASLADLAGVSRKAKAVKVVRDVATATTATTVVVKAANEAGVPDALAAAAAPDGPLASLATWTSSIQVAQGFGEAINAAGRFAFENGWVMVALGAGGVAFGAFRLGQWIVEDFRDGRYDPRQASAPAVGGDHAA